MENQNLTPFISENPGSETPSSVEALAVSIENSLESKLKKIFEEMRQFFTDPSSLSFGRFWQLKQECLECFKGRLSQKSRSTLWAEYKELSSRFHQFKAIVDEQTLFVQQQIDLALEGLEKEIDLFFSEGYIENSPSLFEESKFLAAEKTSYEKLFFNIKRLTIFGERIQSLRKETLATPFRINKKNGFLQTIKKLADRVFPLLREKTQQLSTQFLADISRFIAESMPSDKRGYIQTKEEIKVLQKIAKELPIEMGTFTKARHDLSNFWEKIKKKEQEDKEAKEQLKNHSLETLSLLLPKIEEFKQKCLQANAIGGLEGEMASILQKAKELKLAPEEWRLVKGQLTEGWNELLRRVEEQKRKETVLLQEQKELKQKIATAYIEEVLHLLNAAEGLSREALVGKWEDLLKRREQVSVTATEGAWVDHRLASIKDHIIEKNWKTHLEGKEIEGLQNVYRQLKGQKQELKEEIEGLRRWCGRMSLSVESSLEYQALMGAQKLRFEAIEGLLEEMEETLFNLEEG